MGPGRSAAARLLNQARACVVREFRGLEASRAAAAARDVGWAKGQQERLHSAVSHTSKWLQVQALQDLVKETFEPVLLRLQ